MVCGTTHGYAASQITVVFRGKLLSLAGHHGMVDKAKSLNGQGGPEI